MSRDRDEATDRDVDEYWVPLLKTDGQWDEQKIRNELHDLVFVLSQVSEVYLHITGGKLSKPLYYADVLKAEFDDAVNKAYEDQAARVRELEAGLADAYRLIDIWAGPEGSKFEDLTPDEHALVERVGRAILESSAVLTGPAEDRPTGAG